MGLKVFIFFKCWGKIVLNTAEELFFVVVFNVFENCGVCG